MKTGSVIKSKKIGKSMLTVFIVGIMVLSAIPLINQVDAEYHEWMIPRNYFDYNITIHYLPPLEGGTNYSFQAIILAVNSFAITIQEIFYNKTDPYNNLTTFWYVNTYDINTRANIVPGWEGNYSWLWIDEDDVATGYVNVGNITATVSDITSEYFILTWSENWGSMTLYYSKIDYRLVRGYDKLVIDGQKEDSAIERANFMKLTLIENKTNEPPESEPDENITFSGSKTYTPPYSYGSGWSNGNAWSGGWGWAGSGQWWASFESDPLYGRIKSIAGAKTDRTASANAHSYAYVVGQHYAQYTGQHIVTMKIEVWGIAYTLTPFVFMWHSGSSQGKVITTGSVYFPLIYVAGAKSHTLYYEVSPPYGSRDRRNYDYTMTLGFYANLIAGLTYNFKLDIKSDNVAVSTGLSRAQSDTEFHLKLKSVEIKW